MTNEAEERARFCINCGVREDATGGDSICGGVAPHLPNHQFVAARAAFPVSAPTSASTTISSGMVSISEVCHEKGCQYLVLSQPGSEDWMRKAAEEWFGDREGPAVDQMVEDLTDTIREHFAASQLNTEKK